MNPEEDKLWKAIQLKDVQAFESYYKEQYRFFLLSACKYLGDIPRAQEIVNDVFLKIWQSSDSIEIQSSLRFYIHRSVVNACLNQLEKDKREKRNLSQSGIPAEQSVEWKEMEDNELEIRIYKAIDELPEQCRKVFRMSRFEQLKQQEIADRLGISIKTVKNHITLALQRLDRVVQDWRGLPVLLAITKYFLNRH